jgi:hypothetical protein
VDYDEDIQQENEDNKAYDEEENEDLDEDIEDDQCDWIDKDELEDLNKDTREEDNPNQHWEQDEIEHDVQDEEESKDEETVVTSEVKRSTRTSCPVEQLKPNMSGKLYMQNDNKKRRVSFAEDKLRQLECCHNLVAQVKPDEDEILEYGSNKAMLFARFIQDITVNVNKHGASFVQQYMLQKGLKVFGNKGHEALMKEIDQLHKRICFAPFKVKEMKPSKRKKAQMALMFLTEKRDKSVKGRMVYNGKPTREWLSWEDAASPTAALESTLNTGVIKVKEGRDVLTCNIPNTFIQADLLKKEPGEDRVMMKITGVLVDMLVDINPELCSPAAVLENCKKVIYVEVLKAIYGMLEAALLWYKTFRKDLKDIGFFFNPYNPCVGNKKFQGLQQTIVFHMDNLKLSHKSKSVNDKFEKWLNSMYGKHGKVTATRGQIHNYLWMELDYWKQGELKINMTKYVENMLNNFPVKLGKKDVAKMPARDNLFNLGTGAKLDTKRSENFHTFVAKGLFLCKRARPGIQQAILVLCTRVRDPNQADWEKLMRVMKYSNGTKEENLTLSADNLRVLIKWYVDTSFAVHPDFKSHTGAMMTLGKGAMQSIVARKQKMNVRSSTEGKLVAVDNAATIWFCGQSYSWRHKDTMWIKALSIKTIRAQFYWKQMVRKVQENGPSHLTFVTSL